MNKRGSLEDIGTILTVMITLCAFFVLMYVVFGNVFDNMMTSPMNDSITNPVFQSGKDLLNKLDTVVVGIYIGLVLVMLITSFLVGGHPMFMFFYYMGIAVLIVVASVFTSLWERFLTTPAISSYIGGAFSMSDHIMTFLPIYIAVPGLLGVLLTFIKPMVMNDG